MSITSSHRTNSSPIRSVQLAISIHKITFLWSAHFKKKLLLWLHLPQVQRIHMFMFVILKTLVLNNVIGCCLYAGYVCGLHKTDYKSITASWQLHLSHLCLRTFKMQNVHHGIPFSCPLPTTVVFPDAGLGFSLCSSAFFEICGLCRRRKVCIRIQELRDNRSISEAFFLWSRPKIHLLKGEKVSICLSPNVQSDSLNKVF